MTENPKHENDCKNDEANTAEEAKADAKQAYEAPSVKSLKLSKDAAEALT